MIIRRCARRSCRRRAAWRELLQRRYWCDTHAAAIAADVVVVPLEAAVPYCRE
jgi:hypothetical protein